MAIKEVKREWDESQLGYVKHYILHTEKDVAKLPKCCVGSTAYVSETGKTYTCNKNKEWKTREEAMQEGGAIIPEGATAHQQLVTDASGAVKWEERKLAYKTGKTISWNGNTEGLDAVRFGPLLEYYRVSDLIPSQEGIKSSNVAYTLSDLAEYPVIERTFDYVSGFDDTDKRWCRYSFDNGNGVPSTKDYPAMMVLTATQRVQGMAFAKPGVWFFKSGNTYLTSFSYDLGIGEIPVPDGEADNGKVLAVVDGAFKLVALSELQ